MVTAKKTKTKGVLTLYARKNLLVLFLATLRILRILRMPKKPQAFLIGVLTHPFIFYCSPGVSVGAPVWLPLILRVVVLVKVRLPF